MNDDLSINLEKHETKNTVDQHVNGSLTVIWRDWDNIIKHEPKMVYVSSVNPGEIKGPHTHSKRNGYFVCIQDRKSTRLNSSHKPISYAVFCLKKKKSKNIHKT